MKKTTLMCVTFAATGLLTTSCSNDLDQPAPGNDGNVVITAHMPAGINSRAFSDGTKATTLHYAVYEEGTQNVVFTSENASDPKASYNGDLTFSLSLNLVKGRSYDFIFWADCGGSDSPYTFSPEDQDIWINYSGIKSNDENRDAFFNVEKNITVTGAMQKNIQLQRPFAQLNIGTDDLDKMAAANVELGTVSVEVKDAYNNLNLMNGTASVDSDHLDAFDGKSLVYDFAAIPGDSETFPVEGYTYLAMNYVLTGNVIIDEDVNQAQKETKDVVLAFKDKSGAEINTFTVSAVPFQRNYRTNIYGSLLTSSVDYEIEIVPDYNKPAHTVAIDYSMLKDLLDSDTERIEIPAGASIVIPEGADPMELPDGKTLAVNGTIVGPKSGKIFTVPAGNDVTIEGNGTLEFNYDGDRTLTGGNAHAIRAIDVYGKVNIRNISITAPNQKAGNCIYLNKDSEAVLDDVTVNTGFRAITAVAGATMTLNGGEYNSTSNNRVMDNNNKPVYAYCIVIAGENTKGYFNGTKVTGIQGAVSVDEGSIGIFEDCDFATHNLEGVPNTAYYAIYSAREATAIIKSGKYYAPQNRYAVFLGNNDISGATFGEASLQGGIYSSIGHDQQTNMDIPLAEGYVWRENPDPATRDLYPYEIVKE